DRARPRVHHGLSRRPVRQHPGRHVQPALPGHAGRAGRCCCMNLCTASSAPEWRAWLAAHAQSEHEVWLGIQNKASPTPGLSYAESIEQALCFGWIDSLARKHDQTSFRLRFTPRNPRSKWSAINRERATRLIAEGQMTPSGEALISHAKSVGTWPPEA